MEKQQAKKIVENFIISEMKKNLKENENQLDLQDAKLALSAINHLSTISLRHNTNDTTLRDFEEKIRNLRIEMMKYVEDNSNFKFYGKSPTGFKLIKK